MNENEERILIIIKILKAVIQVLEVEIQNKIERAEKDDKGKLERGKDPSEDYPYGF